MNKIFAILAAGTALAATPAFAQEDPSAAPASAFQGVTVQGVVGYDHNRSGSTVDQNNNTKQSIDGVVYGVGVGYDAAVGSNVTLGAEAEVTGSSAKWDNNNGVPNTFALGRVKAGRDIYVGGRVGFVASPSTMIYAKAGYTNARYNLVATDGTDRTDKRLDTDGWRVGAGVEQKFGSNTFGRLEYRYSNYPQGEFDYTGSTPDSRRFSVDTDRHQVVASVGVRF